MSQDQDPDSKTESPTPRRLQEARKRGDIIFSREVMAFAGLVAGVISLYALAQVLPSELQRLFSVLLDRIGRGADPDGMINNVVFHQVMFSFAKLVSIPMAITVAITILVGAAQTQLNFSWEPLTPKAEKFNVFSKIKSMWFSPKVFVELAKSIAKVALLGYVAWEAADHRKEDLIRMPHLSLEQNMFLALDVFIFIGFALLTAVLVLAVLDYAYQWYEYNKKLRMSKQEIKDEFKQHEGDPFILAKRKQRQREMAGARGNVQAAEDATVVVVNPTHVAVALRYDPLQDTAPRVLCKGLDDQAAEIRRVARDAGVPIVQRRSLARLLYKTVKVGQEVPVELFEAIAEVLAIVMRQKRR